MFRAMALRNVQLGTETVLTHPDLVNLYGCSIGDGTRVGPFVEIQKNSHVGVHCKISSHTCAPEGPKTEGGWSVVPTRIRRGASIGSNAAIVI